MNPIALVFFIVCAVALLAVPRKWAPAVLILGCTYITMGQGIEVASIHLHIYRMMLIVGVLRVLMKGEWLKGGVNLIDKMLMAWGCWAIFASLFHEPRYGLVYTCGAVLNVTMLYFLIRIWCTDLDEIRDVILIVAFILVPLAAEMLMEKATGRNVFAIFGGISEMVPIREGKLRAQGPFLHSILAGTVGATCVPLFIGLFSKSRVAASMGIAAGVVMTFASASSGPVMSLLAAAGAMMLWPFKQHLSKFRMCGVIFYFVLMIVMTRPPYYLMGNIDISGGSTGWHRANLIEMTFAHLSEWWIIGTDHTRHWMPAQGIGADPQHTDITNYFIGLGVQSGLLGMLLVIGVIAFAFRGAGKVLDDKLESQPEQGFMIWCFGASLFSHAVTGLSVSYFDQSILFFWLTIAVINSTYAVVLLEAREGVLDETHQPDGEEYALEVAVVEETALVNAEWRRKCREQIISAYQARTSAALSCSRMDKFQSAFNIPPRRVG